MNTSQSNNTSSDRTILTESQLFQRFLDAPVRIGAWSTLINQQRPSEMTAEEAMFYQHIACCESACLDYELPEQIIQDLRESDNPHEELFNAICELEAITEGLKMLRREFEPVMQAASTETEQEDDCGDTYSASHDYSRFILPTITHKEAA